MITLAATKVKVVLLLIFLANNGKLYYQYGGEFNSIPACEYIAEVNRVIRELPLKGYICSPVIEANSGEINYVQR